MGFLIVEAEGLPDVDGGRRVYGLEPGLDDGAVVKVMSHYHLQRHGRSAPFLEHHLRTVVAISLLHCRDEEIRQIDLSINHLSEREMIEAIQHRISGSDATPVFWDGVRHLSAWLTVRSMLHACRLDLQRQPPLEQIIGLDVEKVQRHQLARRFGIGARGVPDDEQNWRVVKRHDGLASVVDRCAANARATALLWSRHRLVSGGITQDEHDAVTERLANQERSGFTDAA